MHRRQFVTSLFAAVSTVAITGSAAMAAPGHHKPQKPSQLPHKSSKPAKKPSRPSQKPPRGMPPGHAKRYRRGERVPRGGYVHISDLRRWKMGKPPKGQKYVRVGDQVLRVMIDTLAVVAVVGLVSQLYG